MNFRRGLRSCKVDMCLFGLRDRESGVPHRKRTCIWARTGRPERLWIQMHPGWKDTQSNSANESWWEFNVMESQIWYVHTEELVKQYASMMLDAVEGPVDLAKTAPDQNDVEEVVQHEEQLDLLDKDADPDGEAEEARMEEAYSG